MFNTHNTAYLEYWGKACLLHVYTPAAAFDTESTVEKYVRQI